MRNQRNAQKLFGLKKNSIKHTLNEIKKNTTHNSLSLNFFHLLARKSN